LYGIILSVIKTISGRLIFNMKKEEVVLTDDSISVKRKSFCKRWNIVELDEDEDNNKIKIRVLSAITKILNVANRPSDFEIKIYNNDDFLDDYCCEVSMILGIENRSNSFDNFELKDLYKFLLKLDLNNEDDYNKFLWYLEITLNYDFGRYVDKSELVNKIVEALKLSNANVKILKKENDYELYPVRIEFLDEPLIIDNLIWLDKYKITKEHFSSAIKVQRKKQNYRNIVDELRFSLESFFQQLFSNKKSLENQKNNIGEFLKNNNISTIISNMYIKLFDLYTVYNNDNAKHGDNITEQEIDYLIYLTGSFIRLILQVEEAKQEAKER